MHHHGTHAWWCMYMLLLPGTPGGAAACSPAEASDRPSPHHHHHTHTCCCCGGRRMPRQMIAGATAEEYQGQSTQGDTKIQCLTTADGGLGWQVAQGHACPACCLVWDDGCNSASQASVIIRPPAARRSTASFMTAARVTASWLSSRTAQVWASRVLTARMASACVSGGASFSSWLMLERSCPFFFSCSSVILGNGQQNRSGFQSWTRLSKASKATGAVQQCTLCSVRSCPHLPSTGS